MQPKVKRHNCAALQLKLLHVKFDWRSPANLHEEAFGLSRFHARGEWRESEKLYEEAFGVSRFHARGEWRESGKLHEEAFGVSRFHARVERRESGKLHEEEFGLSLFHVRGEWRELAKVYEGAYGVSRVHVRVEKCVFRERQHGRVGNLFCFEENASQRRRECGECHWPTELPDQGAAEAEGRQRQRGGPCAQYRVAPLAHRRPRPRRGPP